MKTLILFLTLVVTVRCGAQEADKSKAEFVRLLKDTAPTETLLESKKLLNQPGAETKREVVEHARERLEKAKRSIPEIRKLIIVGTSVFDYPGLLAHGHITYHEYSDSGYELYFGYWSGGSQGTEPNDFRVIFNGKGVITAVESVIWKK